MIKANARAVFSSTENFKPIVIDRRDLKPKDILIEIKYCWICHSDIHTAKGEWWRTKYPIVPGHEIAGIVIEVGLEVKKYKVGDRVGVGCLVDSCQNCLSCEKNLEQFCLNGFTWTYWSLDLEWKITQWGYSTHIVVTENFVLKIPDNIELSVAAPLLCAWITTYSPLNHWKAGPGKKVAVVGLWWLGHMAVKIAHAMWAKLVFYQLH